MSRSLALGRRSVQQTSPERGGGALREQRRSFGLPWLGVVEEHLSQSSVKLELDLRIVWFSRDSTASRARLQLSGGQGEDGGDFCPGVTGTGWSALAGEFSSRCISKHTCAMLSLRLTVCPASEGSGASCCEEDRQGNTTVLPEHSQKTPPSGCTGPSERGCTSPTAPTCEEGRETEYMLNSDDAAFKPHVKVLSWSIQIQANTAEDVVAGSPANSLSRPPEEEAVYRAALGFLTVSSGVTMSAPFLLGKVIDTIYTAGADTETMTASLTSLCIMMTGVFLCGGAANAARVYLMQTSAVAQAAAGVSMMFYVSPSLASFVLLIVPPLAVLAVVYGRYLRSISKSTQDALAQATQLAEERISNMRTVRAFGKELSEVNTYTEKTDQVLKLARKEAVLRAGFSWSVLYKGGLLMASQHMTVGELSAFLMYTFWVGISIAGLSSFYSELMKGFGAGSRLWELLDENQSFLLMGLMLSADQLKGRLEFSEVSFAYPTRTEAPIFQDLSLLVPAGTVMAVVGPSGSGKSTLVSLLLRLYDCNSVKIVFLLVSQEPVLFSYSIRDNIAYGAVDPEAVTTEEIYGAARAANAFNFIQDFPNGFNTVVGEKGVLLSGGQKQRIAIARALLKNPKILLLDEATSALDAENEFLVQEALERLMTGRTVVIIAHRLSTIQNANAVAVLDQRRIAECGQHTELLGNRQGLFRKLMEKQAFLQVKQKRALR
ncbi:hypothetical protein F7725_026153 [Dissostichus mawsoni]|uniref:Uncharacterized protein n=1 Tax=Dissostichus mawsoni TaxID=36200 RepID=A0A7J5X7R4_DISMA|nr:hypothetical protein F7725_026153 [Dissostichus mawsoni]